MPRAGAAVFAAVALIVLARSAVFVFWEQAHFDANQAVFGLMAKHLSELRAFPVFMYGQPYMLAVEAWLAAPVFLVAGVSVTTLKLPLLAINLAVALILVWLLVRDAGLRPALAGLAALFFVLPSPGTTARLLEASGGTLEPFFYVLLLWMTRKRPAWCGLVLGVGFLNREFTIYGFGSLLIMAAARGDLFTRPGLRHLGSTLRVAAEVWLVVQVAKHFGSAMGPGTGWADLPQHGNDALEVLNRLCLNWGALPEGFARIVTVHWPMLFGTQVLTLRSFVIESNAVQGMRGAGWLLGAAMLLAAMRIVIRLARAKEGRWRTDYEFPAYLVITGALSVAGYVVARCGVIEPSKMRYDMLSIFGAVGLAAWYLRIETSNRLRNVWAVLIVIWAGVGAAAHGSLWSEYLLHTPKGGKRLIAAHMEARGITYGISEYATAYPVTFLTNERIIVDAPNRRRIDEYQREVDAHRSEAVVIERHPCRGGRRVMEGVYFCP